MARHRHARVADAGVELHPGDRGAAGADGRVPRGDRLPDGLHHRRRRSRGWRARWSRARTASTCSACSSRRPERARSSPTDLPGVLIIEPDVHRDGRGFFLETYHAERYRAARHRRRRSCRTTTRARSRGTLRGLHLQLRRPQGKLVRVIEGEIFDVAVDVRRGSPTFGRWVGVDAVGRELPAVLRAARLRARLLRRQPESRRSSTSARTSTTRRARSASPGTIRRSPSRGRVARRRCLSRPRQPQHPDAGRLVTPPDRRPPESCTTASSRRQICKNERQSRHIARRLADALTLFLEEIEQACHLPFEGCRFADLITAGRRECWGSQVSGAEGHRNHAMPFCF